MYQLNNAFKKWIAIALCVMGIGVAGCSPTAIIMEDQGNRESVKVNYTVIYYIHADADYLYHDSDGYPIRNNNRALETALSVAEEADSGEVFIFYQRSERGFLRLFSRKKSQFYHYVNGKKRHQIKYRHANSENAFLSMEVKLYKNYRIQELDTVGPRYFLYYGHEIPSDRKGNYHYSLPKVTVNSSSLAEGLGKFLSTPSQKFDLTVLSTCNNGTPGMVRQLMPYTQYLLASPQNLHLSHIDSDPMKLLDFNYDISTRTLANTLADQTYKRLQEDVNTMITLSLYDLAKVGKYIDELYASSTSVNEDAANMRPYTDNMDCQLLPFFEKERFTEGIKVWFEPAQFGRNASKKEHSGWECRQRQSIK